MDLEAQPLHTSTPPNQSNHTVASTTSNITTCDLNVKSLKESLVVAHKYVARKQTLATVTDLTALLHKKLKAQHKQDNLVMK